MSYNNSDYEDNRERIEKIVSAGVRRFCKIKTPYSIDDYKNAARLYILRRLDRIDKLNIKEIVFHSIRSLESDFKNGGVSIAFENELSFNDGLKYENAEKTQPPDYTEKLNLIKQILSKIETPPPLSRSGNDWFDYVLIFIKHRGHAALINRELNLTRLEGQEVNKIYNLFVAPFLKDASGKSFYLLLYRGGAGCLCDSFENRLKTFIKKNGNERAPGLLGCSLKSIINRFATSAESAESVLKNLENMVQKGALKIVKKAPAETGSFIDFFCIEETRQ